MSDYEIVLTTCADRPAAERLAGEVVGAGMAACVQILDIRSHYAWQGKIASEPECLLLLKTRADRYAALEVFVRERHAYEVPELLRVPVSGGFAPYLRWLDASLAAPNG